MKLNTSLSIISVAFIISLCGFIISIALPQNNASDSLMITALFIAAASGIIASVFTQKLAKSKQWYYMAAGGLLVLIGFLLQIMGFDFPYEILKVSGGVISIVALGYYIYLNLSDFRNSKWIWFMPLILTGCLFKLMHWPGGNIIIFGSLAIITISALVQLTRFKNYSKVKLLLLVWQIAMCVCIGAFYFRHIKLDYFIIGYIFIWLALVDILLRSEKNTLDDSKFR